MQQPDWSIPQRQPAAGIVIALLKTVWEILKALWPVLLLALFRKRSSSAFDRYELIAIAASILVLVPTFIRYYFFQFYIANNELIIKKGWLKKETVVVPLSKIQTVNAEAGLLHQLLGVVKLTVDTAGDTKTEVVIDAVHKHTVTALQQYLQQQNNISTATTGPAKKEAQTVLHLGTTDLLRLSVSANHLETAVIIAAFGFRLFDDVRRAGGAWLDRQNITLPEGTASVIIFTLIAIVSMVMLVSSVRIFLKYYGFKVQRNSGSFYITQGLLQVRQREAKFEKIQAVTWRANPLRRRMGLWLVEFLMAGGQEVRKKQQLGIPATATSQLHQLVLAYYPLPQSEEDTAVHIQNAYVHRHTLMAGVLPALFAIASTAWWWHWGSLYFLLWPLYVLLSSRQRQKKFRLYVADDVLFVNNSVWGSSYILLQWHKIQQVQIKRSLYAQRHNLASVVLGHAGGKVVIPFTKISEANALVNYALYKVESSTAAWM